MTIIKNNRKLCQWHKLCVCICFLIMAAPLFSAVVASNMYLPKIGKAGYALIGEGENFINPGFYVEWTAANGNKGVYALLKYEKGVGRVRMRDKKEKIHRFKISNFSDESRAIICSFEEIMANGKMTYINDLDFWVPMDSAVELVDIYKEISSKPQYVMRCAVKFLFKDGALCRKGHKIPYTDSIIYDKDLFFLYWHSPERLKINEKIKIKAYKCEQYAFITDENKLITVDAYANAPYFSMIDSYIKKHPHDRSKFYDEINDKQMEVYTASNRPSEKDLAAFKTSQSRNAARELYAYSAKKEAEENARIERENREKEKARIAKERRDRIKREKEDERQRTNESIAAFWSEQRARNDIADRGFDQSIKMSIMEREMSRRMDELEHKQREAEWKAQFERLKQSIYDNSFTFP